MLFYAIGYRDNQLTYRISIPAAVKDFNPTFAADLFFSPALSPLSGSGLAEVPAVNKP